MAGSSRSGRTAAVAGTYMWSASMVSIDESSLPTCPFWVNAIDTWSSDSRFLATEVILDGLSRIVIADVETGRRAW